MVVWLGSTLTNLGGFFHTVREENKGYGVWVGCTIRNTHALLSALSVIGKQWGNVAWLGSTLTNLGGFFLTVSEDNKRLWGLGELHY
jgi:hypothetical protein